MRHRRPASGRLRVGCSGWVYADWAGRFYPDGLPAARRLAHYATIFDAVEVNSTHYGTPSEATVDGWCAAVPDDFELCVKLHRFGTHRKKLADPESWVPRALEPALRIGSRAGPVLLQLPPRWRPQLDRLDAALAELRRHGSPPVAVEVRDERWLVLELDGVLAAHSAVLVHHDLLPGVGGLDDVGEPFAFLRFHGPDPANPYHGSYTDERLDSVAGPCAALLDRGVDVHAFFNNDWDAVAPGDALRFAAMVDGLRGRDEGNGSRMSKERAAKIANSPKASKHGGEKSHSGSGKKNQGGTTAQHKAAGRKGGKATAKKH